MMKEKEKEREMREEEIAAVAVVVIIAFVLTVPQCMIGLISAAAQKRNHYYVL